jgi:hypothetical protein
MELGIRLSFAKISEFRGGGRLNHQTPSVPHWYEACSVSKAYCSTFYVSEEFYFSLDRTNLRNNVQQAA